MSSRRETEKRLRPRNSPYKRNHFNQSQYLRVSVSQSADPGLGDSTDSTIESEYNDEEEYED
jgi:hypothetical protein